MSITLTVTAKGQITLRREVLTHLGVRPGDELDADLLAKGRMHSEGKAGEIGGECLRHARETAGATSHHRRIERSHCFGMGGGDVKITADTNVLLH